MKRRDFIKTIGVITAGIAIAPNLVLSQPMITLENLGFRKTKLIVRDFCDDYTYEREDGDITLLEYRSGRRHYAFWTPKGSRYNVWHDSSWDEQDLMKRVAERVGKTSWSSVETIYY